MMDALFFTSIGLMLFYIGMVGYFLLGWLKLKTHKTSITDPSTKVSVILIARDESENIGILLSDLLAQDYNKDQYQIILVDDGSTDGTADIARSFKSEQIRVLTLQHYFTPAMVGNSFKKKAIELAMRFAGGDLILMTDADCRVGNKWISTMVDYYETTGHKMISGPVCFKCSNNIFESFQGLDFLTMVGIGAATLANKFPVMCNGANMAFERKTFFELGGFNGVSAHASGDDVFLLHKVANKYPESVSFLKSRDAIVSTRPESKIGSFIQQRIRWVSKSFSYTNKMITVTLMLSYLFNVSVFINAIAIWFLPSLVPLLITQIAGKFLLDFIFLFTAASFFRQKRLLWLFLPSQVLHVLYIVSVGLLSNIGKYKWKGRLVR